MNNEQQELLDEAYSKYADSHEYFINGWLHVKPMEHSKESFINKCKTNPEFSEKWELKIEERELSLLERVQWTIVNKPEQLGEYNYLGGDGKGIVITDFTGIPTKLITITYQDKTIESYE
jgi:hypothetical protein